MDYYVRGLNWSPLTDSQPAQLLHYARLLRDFGMYRILQAHERRLRSMGAPPASRSSISQLKRHKIQEKDLQCAICLKDFEIGEKATKLPCNHLFDEECIIPWLRRKNSCPVCRYELPTDNANYEFFKRAKIRASQTTIIRRTTRRTRVTNLEENLGQELAETLAENTEEDPEEIPEEDPAENPENPGN